MSGFQDDEVFHPVSSHDREGNDTFGNSDEIPVTGHVIWDWDLTTNQLRWSAIGDAFVCCMPDELCSEPGGWDERIHPEDRERVVASLHDAIQQGQQRWSATYRVRARDGTYVKVVDRASLARQAGGPGRMVGVVGHDVPLQRPRDDHDSLVARLQQSERQLRVFVESIPQLSWSATADGWVDFYNQRWYDYTGATFEQMEGWGWIAIHDLYDLPRMLRIWRRALATGQPWEDEFRLRRAADGMLRWHLSRAVPLRDEQGRVVRWFGTCTNTHDQKLALEERSHLLAREQIARRKAEAASRAKDEFLAVVSHELRTPLNAIVGWSHLLRTGTLDADKQKTAIEKIEKNARVQANLVEDLLDVARIISDKLQVEKQPLDACVPVQAAIDALGPEAEARGVAISFACDGGGDGGAWVCGSAERLQQVVGNLLGNAIKFSAAGQQVEVRVTCEAGPGRAGQVRIDVTDRGSGIPKDFLPHLFERFRQADSSSTRQHGGLGLGLSIARHLIELHGGSLTASSEGQGKGATFTVCLPMLGQEGAIPVAATGGKQEDGLAMRSLTGIKVLGVDDEASARDIVAEVLLACGATVTMAGSVHEALRYFKVERPDVVVSDIAMPEVDGYGLVARIRALPDPQAAQTPLIALTAYASAEDRQRALTAGFDHHLAKPVEPTFLSNLIAEIVKDRLLANRSE